ncbi:MAG: type II toxin-antitoxin system PemK/MazF family toxin [Patescibacteria group bacterium]
MKKNFLIWHEEKGWLHEEKIRPFFHEREVWFTSLGVNVGFEQDGRGKKFLRPVIVLKKFNNEVLWAIPLTKNQKKGVYYFPLEIKRGAISTAILSQIKLIDAKRLQYKIGDLEEKDFIKLKEKIRQLLT